MHGILTLYNPRIVPRDTASPCRAVNRAANRRTAGPAIHTESYMQIRVEFLLLIPDLVVHYKYETQCFRVRRYVMAESCFSNPALPMVAGVGGATVVHDQGFRPADAALVVASQESNLHSQNLAATKDSEVQAVETKFQIERSVKESEIATEKAVQGIQRDLDRTRFELQTEIRRENDRTRDMIQASFAAQAAASAALASQELLMRRLLGRLIPTPAVE